jgi:hypothetical protein
MATNDIALGGLTLLPNGVPTPLPLGGDGVAVSIAFDPKIVSSAGIAGPVFSKIRNPKGVVTITAYASDPIHLALRQIYNLQQIPGFFMGGSAANSHSENCSWAESWITQAANLDVEETASTKTWTIEFGKHAVGQVA